jgi:hypothetical protein
MDLAGGGKEISAEHVDAVTACKAAVDALTKEPHAPGGKSGALDSGGNQ